MAPPLRCAASLRLAVPIVNHRLRSETAEFNNDRSVSQRLTAHQRGKAIFNGGPVHLNEHHPTSGATAQHGVICSIIDGGCPVLRFRYGDFYGCGTAVT